MLSSLLISKESMMPYITDYKQKFNDLAYHIENQDQLRRKANGGNSILFSYPPEEESLYINKALDLYNDTAEFIDISKLFVKFIDEEGWESFKDYYQEFKDTPYLIFRSDDPSIDLFDLILNAIEEADKKNKIPMLIRTGSLFGTGIENLNIMEHKIVMSLNHPLVIFYPSRIVDDNLEFLNCRLASKYRCTLIK